MEFTNWMKTFLITVLLLCANRLAAQQLSFALKYNPFIDQKAQTSQPDIPNLNGTGCFTGVNAGRALNFELDFLFNESFSFYISTGYGQSQFRTNLFSSRAFYTAKGGDDFERNFETISNRYFMLQTGGSFSWKFGKASALRASLGVGCIVPGNKEEYFGEGTADHSQSPSIFYQYYQGRYTVNDPFGYYFLANPSIEYIQKFENIKWDLVLGINSLFVPQNFLTGQVVFFGDEQNMTVEIKDGLQTFGFVFGLRYEIRTKQLIDI